MILLLLAPAPVRIFCPARLSTHWPHCPSQGHPYCPRIRLACRICGGLRLILCFKDGISAAVQHVLIMCENLRGDPGSPGRKMMMLSKLTADTPAPNHAVACGVSSRPPNAGPTAKPTLIAIPTYPSTVARSSSLELSVTMVRAASTAC